MTKFLFLFRQHSHLSDDSDSTLIASSSTSILLPNSNNHRGSSTSRGLDPDLQGDKLYEITAPHPLGSNIDLDIVAIHGLSGHPYTTWTKGRDPNGTPWLQDFLPAQLPNARIFSYGYDSKIMGTSNVAGISDFAAGLLAWLRLKRRTEEERRRSVLFICHSLGGIIVKKALIIANNQRDEGFLQVVKGIAFLGVPHRGSGVVELGKYCAYLLRFLTRNTNANLLADLHTRSTVLSNICIDATHLIRELHIISFYETRTFPRLGRLIVDQDSARLNSPNEEAIPVNADHSSICKFALGDASCELIGGNIVALATKIIELSKPALAKSIQPHAAVVAISQIPQAAPANQPPKLTVHAALWGERDITATLTSRITIHQTLEIDTTHDLDTGDPWYLVHKVTCILYSYEGKPINLMVTHDGAGVFLIHPGRVEPVSFLSPRLDRSLISGSAEEGLEIMAVIWGGMLSRNEPVEEETVQKIYESKDLECSNDFFGFDGYPHEHKTCQIFYRRKEDFGRILTKVAREGSTIDLE